MAKKKQIVCKVCGQEIAKEAKTCPNCGAKNKKSIFKKWWFWAIVVLVLIAAGQSGNDVEPEQEANNQTQPVQSVVSPKETEAETEPETTEEAKNEYRVGDMIQDGNTKIVYVASGEYLEENSFSQPEEGMKYIFLRFAVENLSDKSDVSISYFDFECYADGYAADMYYGGDEELSGTLSAGRATTGCVYFEVPVDAQTIEIEYTANIFSNRKMKFLYEGEQDSGYVQEINAVATEGAYPVGSEVESSRLKIVYLSCEEYVSDNMFITPADGYNYISLEFEFENVGSSDEHISAYSFDCYADGMVCDAVYIRDDTLSATISSGRKTKGTVTFEVPLDAQVVEVEYLSNYWTSNRVVFTAK